MDVIEKFEAEARGRGGRVVLPEGTDPRVLRAARRMADSDLAKPILLGNPDDIATAAKSEGVPLDAFTLISPETDSMAQAFAKKVASSREKMTQEMADRLVRRPLYFGGMLVAEDGADTMVAGASLPTRRVIEAGMMTVGLSPGVETPSSFFLMVVPNFLGGESKSFIYADCGFNIEPNAQELADIAISSAASAQELLGEDPRVAMLSFSTKGSATHPHVDKVTAALELVRARAPGIVVDGEFQADTAIVPDVAKAKLKEESAVAGRANVLVFPNLDAGNIAYKLTQYMAGARAIGPILQGFNKPICDLSRGASVEDIVAATAVGLKRARGGRA